MPNDPPAEIPRGSYGAVPIPLEAPTPGDRAAQVPDPLLEVTLAFMQSVANTYAKDAWAAVDPSVTEGPVRETFAFNPMKVGGLDSKSFPALFAWRGDFEGKDAIRERVQVAQDIRVNRGVLTFLFIMPSVPQDQQRVRNPFGLFLFNVLDDKVTEGRDPSWVHPAERPKKDAPMDRATKSAQVYGSSLLKWNGARRLRLGKTDQVPVVATTPGKGPAKHPPYFGYACQAEYEEQRTRDISTYRPLTAVHGVVHTPNPNPFSLVEFDFNKST